MEMRQGPDRRESLRRGKYAATGQEGLLYRIAASGHSEASERGQVATFDVITGYR